MGHYPDEHPDPPPNDPYPSLRTQVEQLQETVSKQAHDLTLHVRRERALLSLLKTKCSCRFIEVCDRCVAIDKYLANL